MASMQVAIDRAQNFRPQAGGCEVFNLHVLHTENEMAIISAQLSKGTELQMRDFHTQYSHSKWF